MQLSNIPGKLVLPWATSGNKNNIPVASQISITAGAASLADGFPPLTMTPVAAGGVPPSGLDMNGILYEMSAILRWANAGGGYAYDATFATDTYVGGYPKGARVMRSDGMGYWFNTVENNTTDPEAAGSAAAGWVPDYQAGATAVAMSGSSVTLTPAQYGKPLIVITGALSANLNLVFPALAQGWTVINNTTGGYSITAKTASGSGVALGTISQIVGDGTDIYAANPDSVQIVTNVATLRNIAPNLSRRIQTSGYYIDGDGGGAQYFPKVGAAPGTYIHNGGNIIVPNGGDGSNAWLLDIAYSTQVSVKQFGAKGDGVTDDTAFIQNAINYCLLTTPAPSVVKRLIIPCKCKITSSLIVNRAVDSTESEFIIECVNDGALYTEEVGLFFFSSTLSNATDPTYGTLPCSEWVTFKNVVFQSLTTSQNCWVVDGTKLLRIKFDGCYFWKTRAAKSTSFLQSYYFNMCQARQWGGYFVEATGLFDIHVNQCVFEESIAYNGYGFGANTFGIVGGSFTGTLYEGTGGYFISSKNSSGLLVSGNYFEFNEGLCVDLSLGLHKGVTFTGNSIQSYDPNKTDPTFAEILIGDCVGFFGGGNFCDGRLYKSTGANSNITISGDTAGTSLFVGAQPNIIGGNLVGGDHITQLKFPSIVKQPSNDPNTLDDYEEGTFLFQLFQDGPIPFTEIGTTVARFQKVGNVVTCFVKYSWSSKGSAGGIYLCLASLPFKVLNDASYIVSVPIEIRVSGGSTDSWAICPAPNSTQANIVKNHDDNDALISSLPNSGTLCAEFSYIAD